MEDIRTHFDNNQVRAVPRVVEDPLKLGAILLVGFGDAGGRFIDDELTEEGGGWRWDDHSPQWFATERKNDGFVSTLTRIVSILPEGKLLWGGSCQRVEIEEVDIRPCRVKGGEKNHPEDPDAWEAEI